MVQKSHPASLSAALGLGNVAYHSCDRGFAAFSCGKAMRLVQKTNLIDDLSPRVRISLRKNLAHANNQPASVRHLSVEFRKAPPQARVSLASSNTELSPEHSFRLAV